MAATAPPVTTTAFPTMTTTCIVWWLLLPLAVIAAVIYWLSESPQQRIRRWHRQGASQASIAKRMGISRYAVKKALAPA